MQMLPKLLFFVFDYLFKYWFPTLFSVEIRSKSPGLSGGGRIEDERRNGDKQRLNSKTNLPNHVVVGKINK